MTPMTVKDKKSKLMVSVPCGRCPKCIKRRVSQWSFRLMQEEKVSRSAHFITLTYASNHLPFSDYGLRTVRKRDVQLFFKRLRKAQGNSLLRPIKYFAVGEYGGKFKRPHYHALLFNADLELILSAWTKKIVEYQVMIGKKGKPLKKKKRICKTVSMGDIHVGTVTGASVGYCLKYMSKRVWHRAFKPTEFKAREFALMSKGIGIGYLTKKMVAWHRKDVHGRMYCNLSDGKKISMPRFYKDKLYAPIERKAAGVVQRREATKKEIVEMRKVGVHYYDIKQRGIEAAIRRMELEAQKV